ncbi:MAG: hypothetical protein O2901_08405 [Verrucomicrobia bacterium]|nr:hypothetical protein [Verrucomicrobiota bacterium]
MIANHIHDALAQVKSLKELILERGLFRGYSGRARIVCGAVVLIGATVLSTSLVAALPMTHLAGWVTILSVALLVNYGTLFHWFLFDPHVRRDWHRLRPAADAVPALVVGAVISYAVIRDGQFNLLFGVWMMLYGLSQVAYRQSLPRPIYWIGLFYLACGAIYLALPGTNFVNPWPMGIVFFVGEWAGGVVLLTRMPEGG